MIVCLESTNRRMEYTWVSVVSWNTRQVTSTASAARHPASRVQQEEMCARVDSLSFSLGVRNQDMMEHNDSIYP